MNKKEYNERKIMVLTLVSGCKNGCRAETLVYNQDISHVLARQLLSHYHDEELLNRPRRGIYTISKRGRQRLEYIKLRRDISKVTGIDIRNHRKDHTHGTPMSDILKKYEQISGQPLPSWFTY